MDTDSLAIRTEGRALEGKEEYLQANCHKTHFEMFEVEKEEAHFITVEAKRYCAYDAKKDNGEVTCAGLRQKDPKHGEEDFISFLEGFTNIQKQKVLNVDNSLRLDDVLKEFIPTLENKEELIKKAKRYMKKHKIPRNKKYRK